MNIKVILTPLYGVPADEAALAAALAAAKRFSAHIDAIHIKPDPRTMIPYIGEGMSGALIEEMIASAEQQANERASTVRKTFDGWRKNAGIPMADSPGADGPSCGWIEGIGRPDTAIARRGRLADLIVLCRPDGENAVTTVTEGLEAALLDSGRPLLVAPSAAGKAIGAHVVIAWNGGTEASRAVAAALPFLAEAEAVTVLSVGDAAPAEVGADMLVGYLARHGIKARIRAIDQKPGQSVGAALLAGAEAEKADLMVMGAYTHSRLRELVFGGVTREVLAAAGLPVLMAH